MPRIAMVLGGVRFASKKLAMEHARALLNQEWPLGIVHGDAEWFLRDLVQKHPEAERKIGCGVYRFEVIQTLYRSRCFQIHRVDGTRIDFSYRRCFDGEPSPLSRIASACRAAAAGDIEAFFWDNFKPGATCAATGELLVGGEVDVDHFEPLFHEIVDEYLQKVVVTTEDLAPDTGEISFGERFKDQAMVEKFRAFHNERATLRLTTRAFNQKRSKVDPKS